MSIENPYIEAARKIAEAHNILGSIGIGQQESDHDAMLDRVNEIKREIHLAGCP